MKKKCFVIAPIDKEGSYERRKIEDLIKRVFQVFLDDYHVVISYQISSLGSITNQIVKEIYDSDLIIADLTNVNGNVMYELGVADTLQKPVIIICENTTSLPFDKINQRTILYDYRPYGMGEFDEKFKRVVHSVRSLTTEIDNTVTQSLGFDYLSKNIDMRNIATEALQQAKIRNHEKAKIIQTIDTAITEINLFDRDKYLNSVKTLLDTKTGIFNEPILEVKRDIRIGPLLFDYVYKTNARKLFIKIMSNINRGTWSREARETQALKEVYPALKEKKSHILFVIPMVKYAGKQTNGISLLKFDEKLNDFKNYDAVLRDLEHTFSNGDESGQSLNPGH